jgi:hypothetical protein
MKTTTNANKCTSEQHIEVLIDSKMVSELPLLAAMYESAEEGSALATSPCNRAGLVDGVGEKLDDSFLELLHDKQKIQGDQFLICCYQPLVISYDTMPVVQHLASVLRILTQPSTTTGHPVLSVYADPRTVF